MGEIYAKSITLVPLKDIKLNPKNRNKHPAEQIDRLVKIIQETGFRRPGTISNRTGFLVCGEGRYLAAKKLGLKEMPVMFQDYADAQQELADAVADNAIDKWASLDQSGIMQDVKEFEEFDLDTLGIKDFRMVVDKGKADSLVSFCAEGVKKISRTQFEVRKTDFEPVQDVDVLVVGWE